MLLIEDYAKRSGFLKNKAKRIIEGAGFDFNVELSDNSDIITIVFAGQYSSGKSSILKMLTGYNEISIGPGIVTDKVTEYDWNGLIVVDTPGIHTELRKDHDEKAYDEISKADLLIYVVTNELFSDYMADHFRKLAIDKDKAGEMLLVINKMGREAKGNTSETQQIKRDDLVKVLSPYTPEQLNLCFLDAKTYLDAIELEPQNPVLSQKLIEKSGYNEFVSALNSFVLTHGVIGKQTNLLYRINSEIEKALQELSKGPDEDIKALKENLNQIRDKYIEARDVLSSNLECIFNKAAADIREIGSKTAEKIEIDMKEKQAESILKAAQKEVNNIVEKCETDAQNAVENQLKEVEEEIIKLQNNSFSCSLNSRLNAKYDRLPDGVKHVFDCIKNNGGDVAKFLKNNEKAIHELVKKIGHFFGHKFKPWEALKIAKNIVKFGAVLGLFGVAIGFIEDRVDENKEEKMRDQLRENRDNIRNSFNMVADELLTYGTSNTKNVLDNTLNKFIADKENEIKNIDLAIQENINNSIQLEELQSDCVSLIQEIHSKLNN